MYQTSSRSLKKSILASTTRGNLARDALNRINVKALSDLNFNIEQGDRVGLMGLNGSGKTTLLKVLAGIYRPSRGQLLASGRVSALLDINVGMNGELTGYENIILRGMYMGIHPREMRKRSDEIAEFTELGDYLSMPLRTYSSGMTVRLSFAIATCIAPGNPSPGRMALGRGRAVHRQGEETDGRVRAALKRARSCIAFDAAPRGMVHTWNLAGVWPREDDGAD